MKYNFDLHLEERNSLSLIAKQIEKKSIVLEFGPANGRLTHYLKDHLECEVYIVEIDEEAAKDASKYSCDSIVGDAEQFEWLEKWENIEFDYILFADVLEHLRNPLVVLKKTKQLLKDDGKVIFSVPNVAHNSILIDLQRNIFNYTSVGLLDETHIHLFAYYSLKALCSYAGYVPIIEDAVYADVGEIEIHNSYADVTNDLSRILKQKQYGNVYQFVFTLQKQEYVNRNHVEQDYRIQMHLPQYFFKIYVDRGDGWTEANCIVIGTRANGNCEFDVNIENPENVERIRIDPIDVSCLISKPVIKINENCVDISNCWTNGKCIDDYILFNHADPMITIENTNLFKEANLHVLVKLCFHDIEIANNTLKLYDFFFDTILGLSETVNINLKKSEENNIKNCEKDEQLQTQENIIRERDEQLQTQENIIREKDEQLQTLYKDIENILEGSIIDFLKRKRR